MVVRAGRAVLTPDSPFSTLETSSAHRLQAKAPPVRRGFANILIAAILPDGDGPKKRCGNSEITHCKSENTQWGFALFAKGEVKPLVLFPLQLLVTMRV